MSPIPHWLRGMGSCVALAAMLLLVYGLPIVGAYIGDRAYSRVVVIDGQCYRLDPKRKIMAYRTGSAVTYLVWSRKGRIVRTMRFMTDRLPPVTQPASPALETIWRNAFKS